MTKAPGRKLHAIVFATLVTSLLIASSPGAFALDPSLDVSQYAHTTWKIRDGFPKGVVISIAQTPDGYLWLGTESGLFRFDGVRGVPWSPDQDLRDDYIRSLIAARDGTLWIGTLKGLASWKDGKLTRYSEVAGEDVRRLFEDREGTIWFGAITAGSGKLCAIETGSIRCYAHEGDDHRVSSLYEAGRKTLWV